MSEKLKKLNIAIIVVVALCVVMSVFTVDSVYSYLMSRSDKLSNEFEPAEVTCQVEEDFENGVKSNVKIKNTGNTDAYIRAAVVVTFVAEDGKVLSKAPVENVDYTMAWSNNGWKKGGDGYWYYANAVAPNKTTNNLIETATAAASAPDGYKLNVQIFATAVQSNPYAAVENAWGIAPNPENGQLIPN